MADDKDLFNDESGDADDKEDGREDEGAAVADGGVVKIVGEIGPSSSQRAGSSSRRKGSTAALPDLQRKFGHGRANE